MFKRTICIALALVMLAPYAAIAGQAQGKKPLTHDVYDGWKSVVGTDLSRNGSWMVYSVNPQVGDGVMTIKSMNGATSITLERGSGGRFTTDSNWLVATQTPKKDDVDKARREKKAAKDMPKNSLAIVDLKSNKTAMIERVKSTRWPQKDAGWFAYQLEEAPTPPKADDKAPAKPPMDDSDRPDDQGTTAVAPVQKAPEAAQSEPKKPEAPKKKAGHAVGSEWILRRVSDAKEIKLTDVADLTWTEDGKAFVYSVSTKTGEGDGLFWYDLESGKATPIAKGMGQYRSITIHKKTGMVAFLTDRDRYDKDPAEWTAHVWTPGDAASKEVANDSTPGIGKGWVIVPRGAFNFSENGSRLFFAVGAKPEKPATPDPIADEEKAVLDVWSWHDKELQTVQLLRLAQERNRSYEAMVQLSNGKVTQIEDKALDSVNVGDQGNSRFGLASDGGPYDRASSWTGGASDVYSVDLETGVRRRFLTGYQGGVTMTVDGRFAVWYDSNVDDWFTYEFATATTRNVTGLIPGGLFDAEHDVPAPRGPAGGAMMTDDGGLLISDGNDLWAVDPSGKAAPRNVTDGVGKIRNWRFAPISTPREDDRVGLRTSEPIWFSMTDLDNQDSGIFVDSINGTESPKQLVRGPARYGFANKAEDADRVAFMKGSFVDFPNVWVTNTKFESPVQVTDANPQQKDYVWGTSEIVRWTSADGVPLQGVLVKPENFDPSKKYPMIVYFYERLIDQLHQHRVPSPSASTINPTMFASNGYLVFMPDIPYVTGYPGESAERAILPGVTMMLDKGYVKRDGVGIQGQSWGGYQVMHLVTRTNMFKAAGAGAAVSNMTSAYGGIREGSGLVRQFQYEMGQSRIDGSIWDYPLRYIENSPIFHADKVNTPVLMMNNDKDDAVPFWQGVEMFTALRRLDKKVWMLNYNGDFHNLMKRPNRKDLSVRLHQFFDHYLKGDPAPKWMVEGVPAINKGKDNGFELVKPPKN